MILKILGKILDHFVPNIGTLRLNLLQRSKDLYGRKKLDKERRQLREKNPKPPPNQEGL